MSSGGPSGLSAGGTVIVDELTPEIAELLARNGPRTVFAVSGGSRGTSRLAAAGLVDGDEGSRTVGVHVPVNPLAEQHRHHGFGFTGYLLVLSAARVPTPSHLRRWPG